MQSSTHAPEVTEAELIKQLRIHLDREVPGSGLSRMIGKILPESARPGVRVWATHMLEPVQRAKARNFASPVKLHIGCGYTRLQGWVNIDLVGLPVDLAWDIRRPLPFADGTVDAIFHEHVMEHVCAYDGYLMAKDAFRALRPGGVVRIVMPDANKYVRSYLSPASTESVLRTDRLTPMIALQEEFYGYNHRAMYDNATVELFLRTAGFSQVASRSFGESALDPCPDSESRRLDSLYVEAVR